MDKKKLGAYKNIQYKDHLYTALKVEAGKKSEIFISK